MGEAGHGCPPSIPQTSHSGERDREGGVSEIGRGRGERERERERERENILMCAGKQAYPL